MKEVDLYDLLKSITAEKPSAIQLAPLGSNMVRANYYAGAKGGGPRTEVTIAVPGNIAGMLLANAYTGGLILIDRETYHATKRRLETAPEPKP